MKLLPWRSVPLRYMKAIAVGAVKTVVILKTAATSTRRFEALLLWHANGLKVVVGQPHCSLDTVSDIICDNSGIASLNIENSNEFQQAF